MRQADKKRGRGNGLLINYSQVQVYEQLVLEVLALIPLHDAAQEKVAKGDKVPSDSLESALRAATATNSALHRERHGRGRGGRGRGGASGRGRGGASARPGPAGRGRACASARPGPAGQGHGPAPRECEVLLVDSDNESETEGGQVTVGADECIAIPAEDVMDWQESIEAAPNLPTRDPKTGQVYGAAGQLLGTVRHVFAEKTPAGMLVVYCKKHKCHKAITLKRGHESGVLRWLLLGLNNDCNSKSKHCDMFEECATNP